MWWGISASSSRRLKPRKRNKASWRAFFGLRLMRVVGHSMSPVLRPGQLVLVDRDAYRRRLPLRGDIVAVRPAACGGSALVKRLVGLPHESVERDGRRWKLGRGQFFVAGDASEHSQDSRAFGPVSYAELLGVVCWPQAPRP